MQVGLVGLGRMGANMLQRLGAAGHDCVAFDLDPSAVKAAESHGARGVASIEALAAALTAPRVVWLMVPAAHVDAALGELGPSLDRNDIVIDGGNSHYVEALRRSADMRARGVRFLDVGVSGGIWGRELGYCQMIGGDADAVAHAEPLFAALAQGERERSRYLHCGSSGAGHFVKMVHNGIEYGLMQAYAEGFNLLKQIEPRSEAAGEGPTAGPELGVDLGAIAELWRHGSVIRSWLLDLTAQGLARDPALGNYSGVVADSGEGRWTLEAATRYAVPAPALAAALFARFASRDGADFANKLLSAMRHEFGGHQEPEG